MRTSSRWFAVLAILPIIHCGSEPDTPPSAREAAAVSAPVRPAREEPVAVDVEPQATPQQAIPTTAPVGEGFGCDAGPSTPLAAGRLSSIVAVGEAGFAIAGYESVEGNEFISVHTFDGQRVRSVWRDRVEESSRYGRFVEPAIVALDDGHVAVAIIDGRARAHVARVSLSGRAEPWHLVGEGIDSRFRPVLVGLRESLAFVATYSGTPLRVKATYLRRADLSTAVSHDLSQPGMGGAAPAAFGTEIVFADAREGTSPILRAELEESPPRVEVLRPISNLFDPVDLAYARVDGMAVLGFTAIGRDAATAVGLATSNGIEQPPPEPIVPSLGYGRLSVSAAARGSLVVFVAERTVDRSRNGTHEVIVRAFRKNSDPRLSEPLLLDGADGRADLAFHRDGRLAVVYGSGGARVVRLLTCN